MAVMWLAVLGIIKGVLDFINPWSSYWANRAKNKDVKQDNADKARDEAAKKGDHDAFLDARSDKHNAD